MEGGLQCVSWGQSPLVPCSLTPAHAPGSPVHQSSVLTGLEGAGPLLLTLQLVRLKLLMFAFSAVQIKLVGDFTHLGPWPLFFL